MASYAGVDRAAAKHDVLVADEAGAELLSATYAHDEKGAGSSVPPAGAFEAPAGRDRPAGWAAGRATVGRRLA